MVSIIINRKNLNRNFEHAFRSFRILPNFNYSLDVLSNEGQTELVKFLMIDTVLLCGNTAYDTYEAPAFSSLKERLMSIQYLASIEATLRAMSESDFSYLVVAGHFPVWSIAEHGPTKCLVDSIRPLLHKYKVSAYLAGHDHNLQHISDEFMNATVEYIVSGASNFITNSTKNAKNIPKDSLKFHWGDGYFLVNGGFCLFNASKQNMTITFVESNGLELYQTVIYPRKLSTY